MSGEAASAALLHKRPDQERNEQVNRNGDREAIDAAPILTDVDRHRGRLLLPQSSSPDPVCAHDPVHVDEQCHYRTACETTLPNVDAPF